MKKTTAISPGEAMRRCPKCSLVRVAGDFWKSQKHCKHCVRAYRDNLYASYGGWNAFRRMRRKQRGAEFDQKHAAYMRERYARNKGEVYARSRQYTRDHPDKHKAHRAVYEALMRGLLVKLPCERCGSVHRIHAHHDDYSKPLEVIWLCAKHHKERHRELDTLCRASATLE